MTHPTDGLAAALRRSVERAAADGHWDDVLVLTSYVKAIEEAKAGPTVVSLDARRKRGEMSSSDAPPKKNQP